MADRLSQIRPRIERQTLSLLIASRVAKELYMLHFHCIEH